MRIERIRGVNLTGIGNIDWTLSENPVAIFSEGGNSQRIVNDLLEIFYANGNNSLPMFDNRQGLIEVWMSGDHSRYRIGQSFLKKDAETEDFPTLLIEDEYENSVSLPNRMKLGEYLFGLNFGAFLQSGIVTWPNLNKTGSYFRRVHNLRHGGDENFSLAKIRASIIGAQKRVNEQAGNMLQVKNRYDALRRDWESAFRQQEEKRLLMIELKNLDEREKSVNERISTAAKLQERFAVLSQNLDYRELRKLQAEVIRLADLCRESESKLMELTQNSQVDWDMIERLREECLEWAKVEDKTKNIGEKIKKRTDLINELEIDLESSGYQDLDEDAIQHLYQAEKDRLFAQRKLEGLVIVKKNLKNIQKEIADGQARLEKFDTLVDVTEVDEIKLAKKERDLNHWRNSKIAGFLDQVGRYFGVRSIEDRLSFRLKQSFRLYQVSNYKEFKIKLKNFQEQQQQVKQMQDKLAKMEEIINQEEPLQRIVRSCTEILNQAFTLTKTTDLAGWQNGWRNFQQKKQQRNKEFESLHLELDELTLQENLMEIQAEQLREKIETWGTSAVNRDQILAEIMKVARQLRIQGEVKRELAIFTQKLDDALGHRQIEPLAKMLEPLAELEREGHVSAEDRKAKLADINKEKLEIHQQKLALEKRLRGIQKLPSLSVLEEEIEKVKQQWLAFEDLNKALQAAQTLLEVSWDEWQTKYGNELEREAEWIFSKISSSSELGTYFAYRMAVAQLASRNKIEIPLFFIVESKTADQNLWQDILEYLYILSASKQVILFTSDINLWQEVSTTNWQSLCT